MRAFVALALLVPATASARDWYVAMGGTGDGSMAAPFGSVQAALDVAAAGDVVLVSPGTYTQPIQTRRAGMESAPITVRGMGGVADITAASRLLTVSHPYHVFEKLHFDAQYADDDAVRIETAAAGTVLREVEIERATRDCVDIGSPSKVLIERCEVHHCLNATNGRTDAHGIVGAGVRDLVIRDTRIHAFSGDAIQFDPGRTTPAWDNITVEGCTFYLEPLAAAENGFPGGAVTGENAIDTKVPAGSKSRLFVRNTTAYGFRNGLIGNMAAYNLKEGVVAELDGVTIHQSEIALRLRAPAEVTVKNAVIYDVTAGVRYEDNIVAPKLYSSTFGDKVTSAFVEASSDATVFDAKNVLVLAAALPVEVSPAGGSLAVDASVFVGPVDGNYRLVPGSSPIDRGIAVDVATDRDGVSRPQGADHDVGAFEHCPSECKPNPDGGGGGGGGGGSDGGGGCCESTKSPGLSILWAAFAILLWRRRRR